MKQENADVCSIHGGCLASCDKPSNNQQLCEALKGLFDSGLVPDPKNVATCLPCVDSNGYSPEDFFCQRCQSKTKEKCIALYNAKAALAAEGKMQMEANNTKAMREALEAAERFVNEVGKAAMSNDLDAVTICQCAASLASRIAKALAAPVPSDAIGNTAKLREAAEATVRLLKKLYAPGHRTAGKILAVRQQCESAVAAPRRNCDVGTVADQMERFEKWFPTSPYCDGQAHKMLVGYANWVQMPYNESEVGK